MNVEIFFEINGLSQEQKAIAAKIKAYLDALAESGEIAVLDGTLWEP